MALSKLTILNERYVLRNKLGEPGIYDTTYLAWNLMKKETAVVVREYNPTFLVSRPEDGGNLIPTSGPAERLFDYGLNCFLREADATGLIEHPNVIQQQAYFQENGTAYSVSAYHPGATLAAVLQTQEGKLQERAAFAIIVPLLDGLVAGHRKGLLHGRLSPNQIFLTKSGRPMILRFYVTQILLARRCGRASDIAIPGFTPPELLLPDGKKGPWSDVYASGATLYSIITGKTPPQAMRRFDNDPFPDILHKEADISKGLKKVLNRAMALDSNERQQTIQELKQEIIEQMPATSRPYTPAVELRMAEQDSSPEHEIELKKAKSTAHDIATLSREALAKSPLKVSEPNAPIPLSLEEIDSQRAKKWLPKLKERESSGDGIHFNKEPGIDTNPMGPLASEFTYLSPQNDALQVSVQESTQDVSSSFKQVVNSATANRTRKLSVAAIAACIILFVVAGLLKGFELNTGNLFSSSVQTSESFAAAAVAPEVVRPGLSQEMYMLMLLEADSLQQLAYDPLIAGDTLKGIQMYSEAHDAYQRILQEQPADSLVIAQMHRLNALIQSLAHKNMQVAALSDKTNEPDLSTALTAIIKTGDSLMALRKFEEAQPYYTDALAQAPENNHVLAMMSKIESEIELDKNRKIFQNLIRQGESFLKEDLLDDAREAFVQAQAIQPDANVVKVQLSNLDALIEKREEGNRQFQNMKNQADNLFSQQSYSSALITYESAQLLRPDDLYIEAQIAAVKDSLKALETLVKQRNSQYDEYKQIADSLFDAGNLDEALSFYRVTQALNPDDPHVLKQLLAINEKRAEIENLPVDDEGIFIIPEKMPEMLDKAALIDRMIYPAEARRNGVEGMVVVKLLVDENGNPSRMEVLKGIGFGCDREALRVMADAKFSPAMFKGKAVKAWHTHPIKFKILKQ